MKEELKTQKKQLLKKDTILDSSDQLLASQDVEIKNLRFALMEAEQAQKQQRKVYDDVIGERVWRDSWIKIITHTDDSHRTLSAPN